MASEALQLAILLSLKDAASGGLDRFASRLRAAGKEGEKFADDFEKIREELNRDLAIGGIGVASLALMGKGVKIAADYQASMTELRSSFMQVGEDGRVNMAALGGDMQKAEVVALRLGNTLPGTTEDFVQMMQVLKQNGLEIDTILGGAADAVGNLAVATKSVPREIAADFAQFGNLFRLRSEDFTPAADVFSRIYSSTGQTSAELVEAAKYFQGRAGINLGIGGLKDAERMTRLFGLMGKQGMRGSMAGMGLTNFFESYNVHRDKLDDLAKETGIKLEFFDTKGKFVGMDAVIEQMQQFDRLSAKDRTAWMSEIFGTLGAGAGNILANGAAWKQFNVEQDKTIGLTQKNAEISKNFNNQVEALTGSLSNLVVVGFEPLLPSLTSAASGVNSVVGSLTEFAKANPGLMQTLGTIGLYGSTAMVAYAGIKTLTTGFRLMKVATEFSKSPAAFFTEISEGSRTAGREVGFFTQRANGNIAGFTGRINAAEKSVSGFTKKVGGLKGALGSIAGSGAVKIGIQVVGIMAAEAAITSLIQMWSEASEREMKVVVDATDLNRMYDSMMGRGLLYNAPGDYQNQGNRGEHDAIAKAFLSTISRSGELEYSLNPAGRSYWQEATWGKPFGMAADQSQFSGPQFSPDVAAKVWSDDKTGVALRDVNTLARVISQVKMGGPEGKWDSQGISLIMQAMEKMVGTEKFAAAMKILADKLPASFQPVGAGPIAPFSSSFPKIGDLRNPLGVRPFDVNNPYPFWGVKPTEKTTLPVKKADDRLPENFFNLVANPKPQPMNLKDMQALKFEGQELINLLQQPVADTAKIFTDVHKPVTDTTQNFSDLVDPAGKLTVKFNSILTSAGNVSAGLDNLGNRLSNWTPPPPVGSGFTVTGQDGQPINVPSKASGGRVRSDGLVFVHKDEDIVPANVTSRYEGRSSGGATPPVVINNTVNVYGKTSDETEANFQRMLNKNSRELERIIARAMANGRARA